MNREELVDIMKNRAGWRLFWPPWTLRDDMDMLLTMALEALPEGNAPACPVPPPEPDPKIKSELEAARKANAELTRWIRLTFKLDKIGPSDKPVDLLASPVVILNNPVPK